jgi:hypothetical protein
LKIFYGRCVSSAEHVDLENTIDLLKGFSKTYRTDSRLCRAVGLEYIRRQMVFEAQHCFDESVRILLHNKTDLDIEHLEIEGMYCDYCENQVYGYHYKCMECGWKKDICTSCLNSNGHEHDIWNLIMIPSTKPFT